MEASQNDDAMATESLSLNVHVVQEDKVTNSATAEKNKKQNKKKKAKKQKNKDATTAHTKDEEEHAAYMAEYHARPLELDRRSGATLSSKKVKANTNPNPNHNDTLFSHKTSWQDLKMDPKIINLLSQKYAKPTQIQKQVLHSMTSTAAKNHWIQAETGSGKTLACFLPVLQDIWQSMNSNNSNVQLKDRALLGTPCLIICPTQELVQQTQETCQAITTKLCAGQLVVGSLRGKANRAKEKARIRKGLGVLVTTPGRLLDHLQTTVALQTSIAKLKWLILDEVDRLFDLGLAPQLKQVIQLLKQFAKTHSWRTTLVSATVPMEVKETVQGLLNNNNNNNNNKESWAWIAQGDTNNTDNNDNNQRSLPKQLLQYHILVSAKLRLSTLLAFLTDRVHHKQRTVVFFSTCASVDYYHELWNQMDSILPDDDDDDNNNNKKGLFGSACTIDRLHGNVPHAQRQTILHSFTKPTNTNNNKQARILLATDVAARGLNLQADWTVQYDPPCEIADYIHRAGRVARAGQTGQSLLFLLPSEKSLLGILQLKQKSDQEIPALSLTSTLQQAAKLCPQLTQAGLQRNGMKSKTTTSDASSSSSARHHGSSRLGEAFSSELQYRLEECVLEHSKLQAAAAAATAAQDGSTRKKKKKTPRTSTLLDLARAAFLSHMRAYPTKEKLVRHIFGARALHLGHVAKSFALREAPKTLVKNSKQNGIVQKQQQQQHNKKKRSATLAFGSAMADNDDEELASNGKTTAQKRAMLMANAAKLQTGGIDSL